MGGAPSSHAEQGLLPLRSLLISEEVNEVVVNPDGQIWVEYASQSHMQLWDGEIPAARLKTLGGLTPYEYICKIWTSEPDRFILNPIHQMPGLNT